MITLEQMLETINHNYKVFNGNFNYIIEAAEAINQGFNQLFDSNISIDKDDIPAGTISIMGNMAHYSWIMSYIFTSAGCTDSGISELRRAIEFTCYITKLNKNEERVKAWMSHREDEEARVKFTRECKIPDAYRGKKYRKLRPLIVGYMHANYYGSHGNFETIAFKELCLEEDRYRVSYFAKEEHISMAAMLVVLLGYRILDILFDYYKPYLKIAEEEQLILKRYLADTMKKTRLETARHKYQGDIPSKVLKAINLDEQDEIDTMFNELFTDDK